MLHLYRPALKQWACSGVGGLTPGRFNFVPPPPWWEMDLLASLLDLLALNHPSRLSDVPMWKLSPSGTFTVDSFYKFINHGKSIWKLAISTLEKVYGLSLFGLEKQTAYWRDSGQERQHMNSGCVLTLWSSDWTCQSFVCWMLFFEKHMVCFKNMVEEFGQPI